MAFQQAKNYSDAIPQYCSTFISYSDWSCLSACFGWITLLNRFTLSHPLIIQEEKLGQLSWILIPVVFFLLRLIFSMISYCSSIPGGTFMPILVLGALMGTIFATVFIHLGLIPTDNYTNIIVVSMAAYLGAILRAPFTAIILLTEMIGTVEQVLPMIMSVFIAYLILALLGGEPIYTVLRKQMGFK